MRAPKVRIEFQRVRILLQRPRRDCPLRIGIRQRGIMLRIGGRAFQHRRQIIFPARSALRRQVFAVTRTIVEPGVAHQLLIPIHRASQRLADVRRPQHALENCRHIRTLG